MWQWSREASGAGRLSLRDGAVCSAVQLLSPRVLLIIHQGPPSARAGNYLCPASLRLRWTHFPVLPCPPSPSPSLLSAQSAVYRHFRRATLLQLRHICAHADIIDKQSMQTDALIHRPDVCATLCLSIRGACEIANPAHLLASWISRRTHDQRKQASGKAGLARCHLLQPCASNRLQKRMHRLGWADGRPDRRGA